MPRCNFLVNLAQYVILGLPDSSRLLGVIGAIEFIEYCLSLLCCREIASMVCLSLSAALDNVFGAGYSEFAMANR